MADRRGQLVKVIWWDTNGTSRWIGQDYLADVMRPARCESVGWVMADTKEHLSIVASYDGNDSVNDGNVFPQSAIIEIVSLVEQRKSNKRKGNASAESH